MARKNDLRKRESQPTALTASAQRFGSVKTSVKPSNSADATWQKAAWEFYNLVGEFEFVANWVGNNISRGRMYAARNGKEVKSGPAFEAVQELFGSQVGKERALRTLGIQSAVAGESYIFSYEKGGEQKWDVVSGNSVSKPNSGAWRVGGKPLEGENLLAVRTWERHPNAFDDVAAPSRAALPILNEIHLMDQHIEATASSRLASAGILFLPNEMTFAGASETEGNETENSSSADEFIRELVETAQTAILDRANPSALVPIVVTADGETLDKVNLLTFNSEMDSHALETRDRAISRLALALDVPPEILTGSGDVSHWQAWGVDESTIKSHLEPLLMRIAGDLTEGFLWPALEGETVMGDVHDYTIMVDTTAMRLRPNRSAESVDLFNLGELSAEAMRRENGFSSEDAPKEKERDEHLYRQVAKMAASPSMSAQALQALGLDIEDVETGDVGNAEQLPPEQTAPDTAPVPSEEDRRAMEKDAERKAGEAALVAASEQMVFRALERAGNKAKSQLRFKPEEGMEPAEYYLFRSNTDAEASFMLSGAFTQCGRFAADYGYTPQQLTTILESYTRKLLVEGLPHSKASLARMLGTQEVSNA